MARWRVLAYSVLSCSSILYGICLISTSSFDVYYSQHCVQKTRNSCDALLEFGDDRTRLEKKFNATLKAYSRRNSAVCVASHGRPVRLLLMGDSRMRQLYAEIVQLFDPAQTIAVIAGKHEDMTYRNKSLDLTINFKWISFIDEGINKRVQEELLAFHSDDYLLPDIVLVSAAVWTIRYRNDNEATFQEYWRRVFFNKKSFITSIVNIYEQNKQVAVTNHLWPDADIEGDTGWNRHENLTTLAPALNQLAKLTSVLWVAQDPVIEAHLALRRKMITNHVMNRYNDVAEFLFCNSHVRLWQSARNLALRMNDSSDGLHVSPSVVRGQVQIFMNFWCNRFFREEDNLACSSSGQQGKLS